MCASRERDYDLMTQISKHLVYDSHCWSVEWRPGAGRCLVAATDVPAGTKMFTERPLVVAPGGSAGVAKAILALDRSTPQLSGVCHLQSSVDGTPFNDTGKSRARIEWAISVARLNTHGAGGTLLDPTAGRRGVLGLLSSMMQHECSPSAVTHISAEGSLVSLHLIRPLARGDPISISYLGSYQPTAKRQELLLAQHKFVCVCARCTTLPESVRAFWCPNCDDGPCSPTSPAPDCRELYCDECEATMQVRLRRSRETPTQYCASLSLTPPHTPSHPPLPPPTPQLDDEAWAPFAEAEACDVWSEQCQEVLHPYHHVAHAIYQSNLLKLPPSARAEVLQQHAEARQRLYAGFSADSTAHPLVANDIEAAAVALLSAGDIEAAARAFADAASRFASFYGEGSADATRCAAAASVKTLEEYGTIGVEICAHH